MTNLTTRKNAKLQLSNNILTGDTYEIKSWIKSYMDGKWIADQKAWRVDTAKLEKFLDGGLGSGNSIGLRVDDSPAPASHKGVNGWCNKCHSYCYGDCEANS